MNKKIDFYQALWGMEMIPTKENPWTIEEGIEKIVEAGYDGLLNFIDDTNEATLSTSYKVTDLIKKSKLKLGLSCRGFGLENIKSKIDYAAKVQGEFLNIMVKDYHLVGQPAVDLLRRIVAYGKEKGVCVYIETHRGTVTQDLLRTVEYVHAIEDLRLTIDISHYVVSGELALPSSKDEEAFDVLLKRTSSIHLRLSNGEQVQVPLNRISQEQLEHYKGWWCKAIKHAGVHNEKDVAIPIVVELGPEDYQQKILVNNDWVYDCDRWEEALAMKRLIETL